MLRNLSLTLCLALVLQMGLSFKPRDILAGVQGSCVATCDAQGNCTPGCSGGGGGGGGGGYNAYSGAAGAISGGIANMIGSLFTSDPAAEARRRQEAERQRILAEKRREEARKKAEAELQKLKGEIIPEGTTSIGLNDIKREGASSDLQPIREASVYGSAKPIPSSDIIIGRDAGSQGLQPIRESSIWRERTKVRTAPKVTPVAVTYKSPAPKTELQPQSEPQMNGTEQPIGQGANPTGTAPSAPLEVKKSDGKKGPQTTPEPPAPPMAYPVGANDMVGRRTTPHTTAEAAAPASTTSTDPHNTTGNGTSPAKSGVSTFGTPIVDHPDLNTLDEATKDKLKLADIPALANQAAKDNPSGQKALGEAKLWAQDLGAKPGPEAPPSVKGKPVFPPPALPSAPQPQMGSFQGSEAQGSAPTPASNAAAPEAPALQDDGMMARAQELLRGANNYDLEAGQGQLATTLQP